MATYADYPATMPPHDFDLYPSQDSYDISQPYLPSDFINNTAFTTYDSQPTTHAYSNLSQYTYPLQGQQVKNTFQTQTPSGSPHSLSHSFDMQPPNLSASSESGASVSSSAMGSPSLNHQYQEAWGPLDQGLAIDQGMLKDSFLPESYNPALDLEYAGLVANDKLSGCVGESEHISSSTGGLVFPFVRRQLPLAMPSVVSSGSPSSQSTIMSTPSTLSRVDTSLYNVFKSPTTPASAMTPSTAQSPFYRRESSQLSKSIQSPSRHRPRRNSLLSTEVFPDSQLSQPASLSPSSPQSIASQFSQFIPPIGTSYPTLIQPFPSPLPYAASPYPEFRTPHFPFVEQPPSPAPSHSSSRSQHTDSRRFKNSGSQSPYLHTAQFQPYGAWHGGRRPSVSSIHSRHSTQSRRSGSYELDEESREKGLCPIPECGRVFKDLKAHMLTHQNERPEKCPIVNCEYHQKGFARKYDKNRHTLTHYKGTMVCGFCPGSGSAAEKSFNRADVFKRHLTSVHGVEQTPPNSRKKSPTTSKKSHAVLQNAAGTCSTCSVTFVNAQEFYEHLDDCVLRVVQQADPSEAINQKLLSSVADDQDVKDTMERNYLPTDDVIAPTYDEQNDDEDDDEDEDEDATYASRTTRSGKGGLKSKKDNQH
ncbi:hypothetical protein EJ05DRAFT_67776 [Pseudovirgaria hyperparasitica]|uniref:C2H2-type domain-containing protein n=1 Tax=Pseudovirgaria hyperparasitica TaxID=470096 RepID=A0A6A6W671_9PEZI|nr:uncharacterized protein EJ05DRAFT_67776 [Pseudovirgaria hyperparasitica]KAF2756561.1 hypothetical protein EJ05DRAFT_67776 [Pseudovirgaria hyperparasitica]